MILFARSRAVDTDFVARLTDVFPDGRAIQLQAGALRSRYRDREGEPSFLEPGRVYRLEIDMWATANRFKAGHRLRVDISSADFPKFDRTPTAVATLATPSRPGRRSTTTPSTRPTFRSMSCRASVAGSRPASPLRLSQSCSIRHVDSGHDSRESSEVEFRYESQSDDLVRRPRDRRWRLPGRRRAADPAEGPEKVPARPARWRSDDSSGDCRLDRGLPVCARCPRALAVDGARCGA